MKKRLLTIALCALLVALSFAIRGCGQKDAQARADEQIASITENPAPEKRKYDFQAVSDNSAEKFEYESDVFSVVFDTHGASVSSLKLKKYKNADGQFVDLVFSGDTGKNAFMMYWGDDFTNPVDDNFSYTKNHDSVVFTNEYKNANGGLFTVVKTFKFKPEDYLIQVNVEILGEEFNAGEYAYTIAYEPQIGPKFDNLATGRGRAYGDYRNFYAGVVSKKGKVLRSAVSLNKDDGSFMKIHDMRWLSLTSKYFTVILYPEKTDVLYKYSAIVTKDSNIQQSNSLYISVADAEKQNNTMYYYCGPQLKSYLGNYYSGTDNAWGLRNLNLDDAMEGGSLFGWLENLLKWALMLLNKVVHNYGIDIIILTIILKILLWPLQKKSMQSTAKMGAITEEVNEIKAKYQNNPQKQNEEMQKLYKEKGINPMGGCLPLIIQFPILIAFYGLLNKHFELRGATFIPGWIPDLSIPETIATLNFSLPVLGNQVHLLPIIYTASMIFSMKYTQMSNKNANPSGTSMWFMTWGMPLMFFFLLYSAPSGLLLYWTTQNILSIIQQKYTNSRIEKYGPDAFSKKKGEKKEPQAVIKYREKLKKLENSEKNKK